MIFALLLCTTGLPLIFHEELEQNDQLQDIKADKAKVSIDAIIKRALADAPGQVVPFLFFDQRKPIVKVPTAPEMTTDPASFHYQAFNTRTGQAVTIAQPNEGWLYIMLRLHTDLFAGMTGTLLLGAMGIVLIIAIISGVVLYGPFTRRLDFGTIRKDGTRQLKWLDLHNLLGIATVAWFTVVSFTGVINTLAAPIEMAWQASQLVEMASQARQDKQGNEQASIDDVLFKVREALPNMQVTTVAFPGTPFSTPSHITIFLTGDTPITSRLLKPALIDAATGQVVAIRDMPWYATMLFMSQPLHFGDYGGMPLKIIWALLDMLAIVVLASGLYLWVAKYWRHKGGNDSELRVQPDFVEISK